MQGVFPYLVFIGSGIALGAVALSRRRPPSIDSNPGHCMSCKTPMSLRRIPLIKSHLLLGEWECPHCGTRMNKSGMRLSRSGSLTTPLVEDN
jgi:hypothetical protein